MIPTRWFLVATMLAASAMAQGDASAPAKQVEAALSAAKPDCPSIESAFAALARAGRSEGDLAAIAAGRRSDVPCAKPAADGAAKTLGVTESEMMSWLLRHPEATRVDVDEVLADAPAPEALSGEPALPCGLTPMGRRIVKKLDGTFLLLWFRNDTLKTITAYDVTLTMDGHPWRGTRGKDLVTAASSDIVGAEPPLGSPSMLHFDPMTQQWRDERDVDTNRFSYQFGNKDERSLDSLPVVPGQTLEIGIPLVGAHAPTDAAAVAIVHQSCTLGLR